MDELAARSLEPDEELAEVAAFEEVGEASAQLFELAGGGEGMPGGPGILDGEVQARRADRFSKATVPDEAGPVMLTFEAGETAAAVDDVALDWLVDLIALFRANPLPGVATSSDLGSKHKVSSSGETRQPPDHANDTTESDRRHGLRQLGPRLTPTQLSQLFDAYSAGTAASVLAERFDVHEATVREHLRRTRQPRPELTARQRVERIPEAVRQYQNGASIRAVAQYLGVARDTARKTLTEAGITIRPRG